RLAQLEILQGNTSAALDELDTAIQLKPDYAAAYYVRSQVYDSLGQYEKAAEASRSVIAYAPDDPLGWYNDGAIAYARGDWERAIDSEGQALARNPRYANALFILASSYEKTDRVGDALQAYRTLDKLDPGQQ